MLIRRPRYPESHSCLERTILRTRNLGVYLNFSGLLWGYFCSSRIDTSTLTSCFVALIIRYVGPSTLAPRIGCIWPSRLDNTLYYFQTYGWWYRYLHIHTSGLQLNIRGVIYRSKLSTEVLDFAQEEFVDYRRSIFLLQED